MNNKFIDTSSHLFLLADFQNGVVHRDLKLENVLLDENCNIKVSLSLISYVLPYKLQVFINIDYKTVYLMKD